MMSNSLRPLAGFWSVSGELRAVYWGATGAVPAPLPAGSRQPGRLVKLTLDQLPGVSPPSLPGWVFLFSPPKVAKKWSKRRRKKREVAAVSTARTDAPATAPTLANDSYARRFLPARFVHDQFVFTSMPTWIVTPKVSPEENPQGWLSLVDETSLASLFLVRIPPRRGKLPGAGWRNILSFVLKQNWKAKLVPIPALPTPEVLAASVAWEFRVDAGPTETEQATWDLQVLASQGLFSSWVGRTCDPWEATALLRWLRPGVVAPALTDTLDWRLLLTHLPAADARLVVQNVLIPASGSAATVANLFFDLGADGKARARKDLPLAWLSTLFPRRQWLDIERAARNLPAGDPQQRRLELLDDVEVKLASGSLLWSDTALSLWESGYRQPRREALLRKLGELSLRFDWAAWYQNSSLVLEGVLRNLDVTDAALCLAKSPDARWRRYVTKRREQELREEAEFCRLWRARGELSVERELDAWQSFLELTRHLVKKLKSPQYR